MSETSILLQSGFLAAPSILDKLKRNNPELSNNAIMNTIKMSDSFFKDKTDFFYSPEVDDLFERWEKDKKIMKSFEFREAVMNIAYDLFGRSAEGKFHDWLKLQINSPVLTSYHFSLLNDILKRICYTSNRSEVIKYEISLEMYERIVQPGKYTRYGLADVAKYGHYAELFQRDMSSYYKTDEFIGDYAALAGGFGEMLYILKIIFGNSRQVRIGG